MICIWRWRTKREKNVLFHLIKKEETLFTCIFYTCTPKTWRKKRTYTRTVWDSCKKRGLMIAPEPWNTCHSNAAAEVEWIILVEGFDILAVPGRREIRVKITSFRCSGNFRMSLLQAYIPNAVSPFVTRKRTDQWDVALESVIYNTFDLDTPLYNCL